MAKQEKLEVEEKKPEYKRPVLFLRKSKKGNHLYAFNMEKDDDGEDMVLGNNIESLLMNISDVEKVISGEYDSIKVSVMVKEEAEG
jgi:hypothetical protein